MGRRFKNKKILITGGAGFIGSHLADRLIREGAKHIVIIDNLFLGSEENLSDALSRGAVLYKDDAEILSSLEYIISKHTIDIVFNCATKALNYSFINPSNACETNVKVILNLLELQRKKAFDTLYHFSSSEVFGNAIYEPMDENHPMHPTTTYAAGKAAADIILESYVKMFDLKAFIVRPFNNYGPRQNYKGDLAAVIPATVFRILKKEKPQIHGTGNQSRDFIYVMDTIDATVKLSDKMTPGESINISVSNQITIKTLIQKIAEMMDYKGEILFMKARKADVQCHRGSDKKINSLIDFKLTPFEEGLKITIEWYKKIFDRTRTIC
jgi:UDP-glucose 4-epimerase